MPIVPKEVNDLLDEYNDVITTGTTLIEAVSRFAPAAANEVVCQMGGLASLSAGPFGSLMSPGTLPRYLHDFGGALQAACPDIADLPQGPAAPFTGGQCEGVLYDVTVDFNELFLFMCNLQPDTRTVQLPGPVKDIRIRDPQPILSCPGDFVGFPVVEALFGTNTAYTTIFQVSSGNVQVVELTNISVVRADGMPDLCGDPPPSPAPPKPPIQQPPSSPPIPWVDSNGDPVGDVVFSPRVGPIFIDAQARLKIPVVVNINGPFLTQEISIPVSVSLPDFDISFEYGGNGGTTTDPTSPEEPTPPVPVCCDPPLPRLEEDEVEEPGDPEDEDNEPTEVITGAVIATEPGPGQSTATELGNPRPDLLVPRVATFQWEVDIGGTVAYTSDVAIKTLSQYIPAPEGVVVIRGLVGWEQGWQGGISYAKRFINPGRSQQ